jgi:hypothetical protein
MAYTPNTYSTDGSVRDFNITFPFLRESDVRVTVFDSVGNELSNTADYDVAIQKPDATFQIRVVAYGTINNVDGGTALASGYTVTISRVTDISTLITVFQDGASLRAEDINALISQINYALEEFGQNTTTALGKNITQTAWDATNLRITNLAQPTADNDAMRKVDIDSGIGPDITTVAGIAANVTTVAADTADIGTVASDITGTNTIGTVSSNIADVNTVATNIANVNTVAADTADIGTVAADIQVGGPDNIGTVATAIGDVGIVAGINGQVQTVAGAIANVNTVAADTADIGTVATNIANVNTVATDIANVNTVAGQSANITTITQPANLTAIQNAATNAAAAEAALNAFNATYVGAYATDPSTDANGNALTDGDLYYDTTNLRLKFYDAANGVWITLANSVQVNSAATLQAVGDVDFANAGGPNLTLAGNHFIVRDATNARWENTDAAGVKTILAIAAGDVSGLSTVATSNSYNDLANLPTLGTAAGSDTGDFAAASHTHVINDVTNLQSALDAKQDDITATSGTINAQALTTVVDSANVDVREAAVIDSGAVTTSQDLVGDAALYNVTGTGVVLSLDTTVLTAGTIVSIYANGYDVILRQTATTANQFGVVRLDGDTTTNRGGTGTIADTTVANGTLATITVVSSGEAVIAGQGVS